MNPDPQDEITRLRLELHHAYIRINGFEKRAKHDDSGYHENESYLLWIELGNANAKIKSLQFSVTCLIMSGCTFGIVAAIYIFTKL